jgi:hypothetical protein
MAVEWDAPTSCPDRTAFIDELTRLGGPQALRSDGAAASVTLHERDDRFELALVITGAVTEHRELVGDDCRTLVRAAALIVAVALAPIDTAIRIGDRTPAPMVKRPTQPPRAPDPPPSIPPTAAAARTPDTVQPPRADAPRRALGFVASVTGGPAFGLTPGLSGALAGEIGLSVARLRVMLVGRHVFARRDGIATGVGVRAQTSGAGIHVLWAVHDRGIALELGGGLDAGATSGAGDGSAVIAKQVTAPWLAIVARAGAAWPPQGRVAITVRTEAAVSVLRPSIGLRDDRGLREVFSVAPVSLHVLAGALIRLP